MFNLFKRKNRMKELERRVLVLESNITKLNAQKEKAIDFQNICGEMPTLSFGNYNEKVVVPLENTEFIDELASQIEAKINTLVATKAKVDKLKTGAINVEKNSSFSTPTNWEPYPEDIGVLNYKNTSPKANRTIIKVGSSEGNETTVTFDKEEITLSVSKPSNKKEIEGIETILNIDGVEVTKILKGDLVLAGSIRNIEETTANISELRAVKSKEELKGLGNYKIIKK
ncbi:hypothetical protein [Clostridium sp. 1001271B_151109_B4]|uniref:hypothetical protein n=1 Tax=Clostridium sp. 1001271B_151109_B4 TaxID=2787148 RepID=UPI0018AA5D3D|nr:hypothetical protein [Clostridium sp. 1001271B_151109_B4]